MQIKQVLSTINRNKGTSLLLILQVALTLMIVANTVFESLVSLQAWNQPTYLKEQELISVRYQVFDASIDVAAMVEQDKQRLMNIDGISEVVLTSEIPLDSLRNNVHDIYLDSAEDAKRYQIEWFDSSEKLLPMLAAKMVEGRNFYASEIVRGDRLNTTDGISSVMISEAFAKYAFPGESALDKTIWLSQNNEPAKVIGVYSDWLAGEALDNYHTMIRPKVVWGHGTQLNYFIQSDLTVTQPMLDKIADALYQTRGRYVSVVEALSRPKKRMYDGRLSHAFTMTGISLLAILITGLGVTGLISFSVNQRKKQIGIRRALGGTKRQIVNFFILEVSLLTLMGVLLGVVLMFVWNYVLVDSAGGTGTIEWMPLLIIICGIYLVNLIASWLPSRRAAQIDPAIVTRGV